jgi:hypothetical protein
MSLNNSPEKMPAVWSENGNETPFPDLSDGYFVKVSLHSPNCANSSRTVFFGIYRGIENTDCGSRLILETEGERLVANSGGRMCESGSQEFYLYNIMCIEILARDFHAVSEIFHALGVSEVYRKYHKKTIDEAQARLEDLSGLNFLSTY